MGLFDRDKRTGGFMDEIRCDEPSKSEAKRS